MILKVGAELASLFGGNLVVVGQVGGISDTQSVPQICSGKKDLSF